MHSLAFSTVRLIDWCSSVETGNVNANTLQADRKSHCSKSKVIQHHTLGTYLSPTQSIKVFPEIRLIIYDSDNFNVLSALTE